MFKFLCVLFTYHKLIAYELKNEKYLLICKRCGKIVEDNITSVELDSYDYKLKN